MPFDIPETHVTDDPIVVFAFVALFAAAIAVALVLAMRHSRLTSQSGAEPEDD